MSSAHHRVAKGLFRGRKPVDQLALINFKPSQFATMRAGVARVLNNTGRARFVVVGTSITRGVGSGDGGNTYVNAALYGYVTKMAQQLAALGIPTNTQGFLGSGAVAISNINTYGAGITVGAGWVISSAQTFAGFCLANNADETTIVYAPTVNVDNFEAYYPIAPTASTLLYSLNGAAVQSIPEGAANNFQSTVIPVTRGAANTLAFSRTTGNAYLAGVRAWDSTVNAVDVFNLGASGWKASDMATATVAYNSLPAIKYVTASADLTIIEPTANDAAAPTAPATFKTNVQAIITGIQSAGSSSILLMTSPPGSAAFCSASNQQAMRQAMMDLAYSNGLPLLDQITRCVDYPTMAANQMEFDTLVHPNKAGHAFIGNALGTLINNLAR